MREIHQATLSTVSMFRRLIRILVELLVLAISSVVVYTEQIYTYFRPKPLKSLKNEVILVTGSANGLGRELCKILVSHNAKLVLWDVSTSENLKSAQLLKELGASFVFCDTVDVSDPAQVSLAAEKVRKEVGHVTVLVNNAGICPMQQFLELTQQAVQQTFQTNVLAHFWTLKEFLPEMVKQNKGHIVTICSTMGQMAIRGPAPYYSSKHAVHGLVECLKDELAHMPKKCDVKFTTAYPFFMRTRMVHGNSCGLYIKFKFPSITPFMEPAYVARRIVDGICQEREYLYIPETFRIYLAGKFFLPSKLHRIFVDFFVEESGYSSQLGDSPTQNYEQNSQIIGAKSSTPAADINSFTNLFSFANELTSAATTGVAAGSAWGSDKIEKEK